MDWTQRYRTELSDLFSYEGRIGFQLKVELSLLKSLAQAGRIPMEAYDELNAAVEAGKVTVERVHEIEKDTHHDIMAMVHALAEQSEQYGGFVHYGATSQDINDTVLSLQLKKSKEVILASLARVRTELTRLATKYRDTTCISRTHGQHAIPTTMGFKFANFLYEVSTAASFMARVDVPCKFSGAVGTYASLNTREVGDGVAAHLGVHHAAIATQTVSRLFIADFMFALTAIASSLERLAKEVRNLQRTEVDEVREGFGSNQVGSSTMPQKRNPHKSERVCGVARVIRSTLAPSTETVALEHERDLTNSSCERIALGSATVLTHYITLEVEKILSGLVVNEEGVKRNLNYHNGKQLTERIMMALADKLGRQEAHEILRVHSGFDDFGERLRQDSKVSSVLSADELTTLLDPETYTGCAGSVIDDTVAQYGAISP